MLSTLFKGIKELVYPDLCLVCKNKIALNQEQNLICANCLDKIERNLPPFCANCGRHLDSDSIKKGSCTNCRNQKFYFDRAFSPCIYTGSIKSLIHEFKYSGKDYLGETLGLIMNDFIKDYNLPIEYLDYIIPIPLYNSRLREREFNQSEILSKRVAQEFNKEILSGILIRNRLTNTQTELTHQERFNNAKDSFSVISPERLRGKNLLLIDDVLTTASTSNEAAKCLKEAGANMVILLTLAN